MKAHYPTLVALTIASLAAPLSHAQTYTNTTDPLTVVKDAPVSESYINRTTDDTQKESVTVGAIAGAATYHGHNVNIINNASGISAAGLSLTRGGNVTLTADPGTWSTITVNGAKSIGLRMGRADGGSMGPLESNLANISFTRTRINANGESSIGLYAGGGTFVGDVDVLLNGDGATGIRVRTLANFTANDSQRGVRIVSTNPSNDVTGIELFNYRETPREKGRPSTVNLQGASFDIAKGTIIKMVDSGGTCVLSDSIIKSGDHNTLISGSGLKTLANVDLSQAKNQLIEGSGTIQLSRGTVFDGYTSVVDGAGLYMAIDNASWHVRRDSDLAAGKLSLTNRAAVYFSADGAPGDFTNINAATVMLGQGTLLQLDADSGLFSKGDVITLFTGLAQDGYTNDGALLVTTDGMVLVYDDQGDGSYIYTGQMYHLIPEPATATLGLLGLTALACRRRR